MFGALNRFIARLDSEPQPSRANNRNVFGFQVLRNTNPDLHVEPWFDFIIGINGRNIDSADPNLFATEVRNCAGTGVELGLWSAKGQRIRSVYVPLAASSSSLGLSLQWTPLSAIEDVWHILDVTNNSPADEAGLLPYGDYIIGSPEGLVKGESGLGELVEDYLNQPLRLYVYNHEYNVTRLVTINPSRSWGGTGALGCILGFGALHRIPASLDEPPQAPGETLFETARLSTDTEGRPGSRASAFDVSGPTRASQEGSRYLIPAEMNLPPKALTSESELKPPPTTPGVRKAKTTRHTTAAVDIDDYFREGEAKSREHDHAPSPKPKDAIAPPPKAGVTSDTPGSGGITSPTPAAQEAGSSTNDAATEA